MAAEANIIYSKTNSNIGGRNNVQLKNRAAVLMAKDMEERGNIIYKEGDAVIGCIYQENGYYTKYYLKPDPDNIARFICSSDQDKLLCNASDYAIASTMGIYLDVSVSSFLDYILPYLRKYQGSRKYPDFESID